MTPQPAYWSEEFTPDERARLAPYVTNLDRPVFALRNLPETVKGALFARYSRSGKTLRRLFLDEFADDVQSPGAGGSGRRGPGNPEGVPRSEEALSALECRTDAVHPGGDHSIVVGEVIGVWNREGSGSPLLYHRGGYRHL